MAFSDGFFDAKNRDRVYTAENFTSYLSSLICNGILDTYGQCFAITAHNNMTVTIGTGKAWINGHYFENNASYTLNLSPYVNASFARYVAIGICCDTSARACSLVVEGKTSASPFTSFGARTYLTLAVVLLAAGTSAITAANITDYRDDDSKCGYVRCILGKCEVSALMSRLSELEERASALETLLGVISGQHEVVNFHSLWAGTDAPVGNLTTPMAGLECIVGSLDEVKLEET